MRSGHDEQEKHKKARKEMEDLLHQNQTLSLKVRNFESMESKMRELEQMTRGLEERNRLLEDEIEKEREISINIEKEREKVEMEKEKAEREREQSERERARAEREKEKMVREVERAVKEAEREKEEIAKLKTITTEERRELLQLKDTELEKIQSECLNVIQEMKRKEDIMNNKISDSEKIIMDLRRNEEKYRREHQDFNGNLQEFRKKETQMLQENEKITQELKALKQELDVLKAENHKHHELMEKLKDENEGLRVKLMKDQGKDDILKENLGKINEFREENEKLFIENEDLKVKMAFYLENEKTELENNLGNLNKSLKELKKENERLKEELEHHFSESSRITKVEIETLQRVLEKKTKIIEKYEASEKEMMKNIENLKKLEGKYKEVEDFNNSLMKEKKFLLEENDKLYTQLNKKDFYEETVSLKQKLKNIEEEKNLLKTSNAESLDKLNGEILKYQALIENYKKKENELITNLSNSTNSKEPNNDKKVIDNPIKENQKVETVITGETNAIPGSTPKNADGTKQGGGFMYGLASFFLTDKELKSVKK